MVAGVQESGLSIAHRVKQAYVAAAPDRTLWATDWPHVHYAKKSVPNDADLLGLLYRYVPDPASRYKVLVDNPARLYGFDG